MSNTVRDLTRAIDRVDRNASANPDDTPPGDNNHGLTFSEMLSSVANNIGHQFDRAGISPRKVTDQAVVAVLAAHGMSYFGLEQWAGDIADRVRSNFAHGRMSSESLDDLAARTREIADARNGAEQ